MPWLHHTLEPWHRLTVSHVHHFSSVTTSLHCTKEYQLASILISASVHSILLRQSEGIWVPAWAVLWKRHQWPQMRCVLEELLLKNSWGGWGIIYFPGTWFSSLTQLSNYATFICNEKALYSKSTLNALLLGRGTLWDGSPARAWASGRSFV